MSVLYNLDEAVLTVQGRRHEVVLLIDEHGQHWAMQVLGTGRDVRAAETIDLDRNCFVSFWPWSTTSCRESISEFIANVEVRCPESRRHILVVLDNAPWHGGPESSDDEDVEVESDVARVDFHFLPPGRTAQDQPIDLGLIQELRRRLRQAEEKLPATRKPTLLEFATLVHTIVRAHVCPLSSSCFGRSETIAQLQNVAGRSP